MSEQLSDGWHLANWGLTVLGPADYPERDAAAEAIRRIEQRLGWKERRGQDLRRTKREAI